PYEIWLWWIAGIALAIIIGALAHRTLFLAVERIDAFHLRAIRVALLAKVKKPSRIIFPMLAIIMVMPLLPSTDAEKGNIQHIAGLIAIALIGWGTLIAFSFLEGVVPARYSI